MGLVLEVGERRKRHKAIALFAVVPLPGRPCGVGHDGAGKPVERVLRVAHGDAVVWEGANERRLAVEARLVQPGDALQGLRVVLGGQGQHMLQPEVLREPPSLLRISADLVRLADCRKVARLCHCGRHILRALRSRRGRALQEAHAAGPASGGARGAAAVVRGDGLRGAWLELLGPLGCCRRAEAPDRDQDMQVPLAHGA
mmetsp:Transcript_15343/g.48341  ORF Transcript_15343/g.48341 Transcript_15343/m.48341 type:complete len:200 (+) Transcript_15343:657-1256(+)